MNKPRIAMVENPCEEACKIIDEAVERCKSPFSDYVWTGLSAVNTNVPVFSPCTGVDHINAPEIIHLDSKWKATEGQKITSTAEHTLSLMLQLAKKKGIQLNEKVIAIIGSDGRIGSKMKKICHALNMPTMLIDKRIDEDNSDVLRYWLKYCDVITLHVPLNDETYHMIGKKEIEEMKDGTLLINTSRQAVVDIEAVKEALIAGKIYYADDFKNEVDLTQYGAMQTPHIGGNCIEAREATDIYIARRLSEYIRNKNV